MNPDERFIKMIMKQFFPYKHEKDIESERGKWEVSSGEYIASWLRLNLIKCRKKNGCAKRERCEFFDYTDLARQNFRICNEMILRLEDGGIKCELTGEEEQ